MMTAQFDDTAWPYSFVHPVPSSELETRAKALEAQGFRPGQDWIDLLDYVEREILKELRDQAEHLNLREHKIEHDWNHREVNVMAVICSFEHETDMTIFKLAVA